MGRYSSPEIRAGGPSPWDRRHISRRLRYGSQSLGPASEAAQAECCLSGQKLGPRKSPGR